MMIHDSLKITDTGY